MVDDLVSLTDLAPTFLELAGVPVPDAMTGRSLVRLLTSDKSGQVDQGAPRCSSAANGTSRTPARITCPIRSARFARTTISTSSTSTRTAGRWAIPTAGRRQPADRRGADRKHARHACRTKTPARPRPGSSDGATIRSGSRCFDLAYGKRPREELYDLKADPHQMKNVAAEPKYAAVRPTWSGA